MCWPSMPPLLLGLLCKFKLCSVIENVEDDKPNHLQLFWNYEELTIVRLAGAFLKVFWE